MLESFWPWWVVDHVKQIQNDSKYTLITKTIFTIDKLRGGLRNDRGAGAVSEASDCGGAAVACGEVAVAGCENNSRRA